MKKKVIAGILTGVMAIGFLAGCSSKKEQTNTTTAQSQKETTAAQSETAKEETKVIETETIEGAQGEEKDTVAGEDTEIQVFIAASLNTVMTEIAAKYNEEHPNVKITFNADSSGTLLTQIQEGYECDIFFSAAQKQMDQLEEDQLAVDGTRANVLNNQVVVLTLKDSGTKVTGLENLQDAESIALAGGSVPVGKYTRQALVNLGVLPEADDVAAITTEEIVTALGGVEISEQDNVSKVLIAVTEGSCEVGTTYYSDTYGYEDKVEILETVSYDLTGNVIYPICRVINDEADEVQTRAAEDFYKFVLSEEVKAIFNAYYFDTNVE